MPIHRLTAAVLFPAVAFVLNPAFLAAQPPGSGESWHSALHSLAYVVVEKRARADLAPSCPDCGLRGPQALESLPAEVLQGAGGNALEYEGFLSAYLPEPAARALAAVAQRRGLTAAVGLERVIHLPWHSFTPGAADGRDDLWVSAAIPPVAVPGLYLIQFAYPILPEWLAGLDACGVVRLAYFQSRTYLVRAPDLATITSCPVAKVLSWSEPYRASDRIAPDLLSEASPLGYWLQFAAGTDLDAKAKQLPSGFTVQGKWDQAQDHVAYLRVQASVADLAAFVAADPDLLTVSRQSEAAPSDERQGEIISGNHYSTSVCTNLGSCPYARYESWLSSRNLLATSSNQIVAVIDVDGYDNGKQSGFLHHPDLQNPADRLDDLCYGWPVTYPDIPTPTCNTSNTTYYQDIHDHPTMVAGIIAADGSVAGSTLATDPVGYYTGMGVAPRAKIFSYRVFSDSLNLTDMNYEQVALNYSRNRMDTGNPTQDRAFIANNSWNEKNLSGGFYFPVPTYDPLAQFYDNRVLDANASGAPGTGIVGLAGNQAMTIVFSAGNYANNCGNGVTWDSVSSPAVAKNVITVGATASYRPAPEPPLSCQPCINGRPADEDATDINQVASFSGRGRQFAAYPSAALANNTRIKPDLVAPGVRVFSTVPWNVAAYNVTSSYNDCMRFYPDPNNGSNGGWHSYGSGTSFAAPVVSGAAALARQWFIDHVSRLTDPPPSLIKAALIATADDLGSLAGNDHRPSPLYGWGRVALDRLSDGVAKTTIGASAANSVGTGGVIVYSRLVNSSAVPVLVVLVWDDPASDTPTNPAPLKNDLNLDVGDGLYRGNFFNENVTGTDDGWSYRWNIGSAANDTANNVEAVFIPAGTFAQGTTLRVKVTGVNNTSSQPFSVYAYNLN